MTPNRELLPTRRPHFAHRLWIDMITAVRLWRQKFPLGVSTSVDAALLLNTARLAEDHPASM